MLFDPFEEQLDLPAVFVKSGDGQWWQHKVVGQKHERLASLGVFESNPSELTGVVSLGSIASKDDRLIADHASLSIVGLGVNTPQLRVVLGPNDKERAGLTQRMQTLEVEVATIHDVKGAKLGWQEVQYVDFVHLPVADVNKGWDITPQIEQRVKFDCAFGATKVSPVEQTQTQIDGRRIQCVDSVVDVQAQIDVEIELSGLLDQHCSHIGPNTPVSRSFASAKVERCNGCRKPKP